jgi:peptidyl-prolyl cis-trans isomerase B (cyclophilin B)
VRRLTVSFLLAAVLVAAGCGGSGDDSSTTASGDTTVATTGDNGCTAVDAPPARDDGGQSAPTDGLDPAKTYTLTFETSCGTFVVTLDQQLAPHNAASLVQLAKAGFFDDTIFHRIVPGFVIQGGDPLQAGTGGPGYTVVDTPKPDSKYVRGVVAMAKSGAEPAGTGGSQFFVVTGDDIGLPPDYAIVGEVTDGQSVVDRIGKLGNADEQPLQPIVIHKVTVGES